jgi:hypothetical protein
VTLHISSSFSFPKELQTQTTAILAKRGVGKTYTGSVIAEEMAENSLRFVVIDPVGVWWGLRSSASGKRAGIPVVVLGGDHGDAPLEPTAGAVIADLVVEEGATLVLDLSLMRKGEQDRFVTDFAERLYLKNRAPIHLFVDEADAFAPQSPMPDQRRMLGAMEDLVRRGRARGIGLTLITQRAAVLNKNVLTQIEVLIAMRTVGPHDRKAIESWIEVHGEPEQQETLLASLPSLKIGEAWVWSPGWLKCFERIRVRERRTFDSSATPEVGVQQEPAKMADIDLGALKERMAATIERAKANDPKALKAEVARLTIELSKRSEPVPGETKTVTVEVPVLTAQDRRRLSWIKEWLQTLDGRWREVERFLKASAGTIEQVTKTLGEIDALTRPPPAPTASPRTFFLNEQHTQHAKPPPRPARPKGESVDDDDPLRPARRKILNALAFILSIQISQPSKKMLALFCGKSPKSGGYNNDLGKLRSSDYIDYPLDGLVSLTESGLKEADASDAPRSLAELHAQVERLVKPARWEIVSTLISLYPKSITRDDLAARIGRSSGSGGFNNNLGMLRSSGIIDYPGEGNVAASEALFPPGLR